MSREWYLLWNMEKSYERGGKVKVKDYIKILEKLEQNYEVYYEGENYTDELGLWINEEGKEVFICDSVRGQK